MRKLIIRLRNIQDVDALSQRVGANLRLATSLQWIKGEPDLFGSIHSYRIKKTKKKKDEKWLDLTLYRWKGMPLYKSRKIRAYAKIKIDTNLSSKELSQVFEQPITEKTKSLWYPRLKKKSLTENAWHSKHLIKPRYPIYVISKGRYKTCRTAHTLDWMGLDYKIVVEPSEEGLYREKWGEKVLVGDFDTTTKSSIPVRNWVNEYCQEKKYWLLDDNINYFYILNNNKSLRCKTGAIFALVEDYVDRYKNIALAGMNKLGFCKPTDRVAPYILNTRVYSITLMNKEMNEKIKINGQLWRGRYNEDTDLNIRFLKAGYCTINFQMFLGDKATTMTVKGGNTTDVYGDGDKRLKFSKSLKAQHPDIVTIVKKWNRYHHKVNWSAFNNTLEPCNFFTIRDYGLFLGDYYKTKTELQEKILKETKK